MQFTTHKAVATHTLCNVLQRLMSASEFQTRPGQVSRVWTLRVCRCDQEYKGWTLRVCKGFGQD